MTNDTRDSLLSTRQRELWAALSPAMLDTTSCDEEGQKFDEGKTDWDLMPWGSLEYVVDVLKHGEQKYGRDNWQYVEDADLRYWNAAMRHMIAYQRGEPRDPESGLSHLAHAVCSLLFVMALYEDKGQ